MELDVRGMRKPDQHPAIFAAYADLSVGECLIVINDHDPVPLRDDFEVDHPGSFGWEYLKQETSDWRVRITKLAATPLPRVLVNAPQVSADPANADAAGALWRLEQRDRGLDANLIALPANEVVAAHLGPDLDVLLYVVAGSGTMITELSTIDLVPGALVWLPKRSRREIRAGEKGLRYLTTHQKRQSLLIVPNPHRD